jgi:predicted N-formylglutamate amidohydrolase
LGRDDPSPVIALNEGGSAPFLLLGDHAGRVIPAALADLGLPAGALDLHIAWDIGVAGLGERLSAMLDAPFVRQAYSRLVIDCNRAPDAADAMPAVSDRIAVPGNAALTAADRAARTREIHQPYQTAIAALIAARRARGLVTHLVSLHSFTPVFQGFVRPWRYGVLHRGDSAFSQTVLALLQAELGEAAGDNQPYAMDGIDHTIPFHADGESLDYLELETRQDLIADAAGQARAAEFIASLLERAVRRLG